MAMFTVEESPGSRSWFVRCGGKGEGVVHFYTHDAEKDAHEYAAYRNAQEAARQVMEGTGTPSSPPKKYAVIESMTRCESGDLVARVWTDKDVPPPWDDGYVITDEFHEAVAKYGGAVNPVAEALAALPKVNAVEVTYKGQGIVLYNNW